MKKMFLFFCLFSSVFAMAQGQTKSTAENVTVTSSPGKTLVMTNEQGELLVNVSPEDVLKIKANGSVRYSDFGARGDGKTDDTDAIAAAHAFANQQGLSVKADEGFTYYLGGKNRTAVIWTNTDFGTAPLGGKDVSYPVMPLVSGGSLKERIRGPVPPAEAVPLLAAIAPALDQADSQGTHHRQVQPGNVPPPPSGRAPPAACTHTPIPAPVTTQEGGDD